MSTTDYAAALASLKNFAADAGITAAELQVGRDAARGDAGWTLQICLRYGVTRLVDLDPGLVAVLVLAHAIAGNFAWTLVDITNRAARAQLSRTIWAATGLEPIPALPCAATLRKWAQDLTRYQETEEAIAAASGTHATLSIPGTTAAHGPARELARLGSIHRRLARV